VQGDRPSTFIGPTFSVRLFRRLDVTYGGAVQALDGVTQQHVGSFNYEISPRAHSEEESSYRDRKRTFYMFYKNSGGRGHQCVLRHRRPQCPKRFVKRLSVKFVFAL